MFQNDNLTLANTAVATIIRHEKEQISKTIKTAAPDTKYFVRSRFSRSLVQKKNFGLIWQVVFKLNTFFVKGGRIPLLSLIEVDEKSRATNFLGDFVNKACLNSFSLVKNQITLTWNILFMNFWHLLINSSR